MDTYRDYENYLRYELGRSPLTVSAYMRDLREYVSFITSGSADFDVKSVTTSDVRIWLASLSQRGLTAVSIKRKLQSLRAYMHFCLRRSEIAADPTTPIEMSLRRRELPRYVPSAEMEQLLADEPAVEETDSETLLRDRLILILLYTTGIRRAELLSLRDSDVDLHRWEIMVTGKGGKQRTLPIAADAVTLIERYRKVRCAMKDDMDSHPLLRHNGRPLSATKLAKIVRAQLAGTSTDRPTPHTLRHTFATSMLNNGAEINTVQKFLGHASLETTRIYTHVTFADIKRAYGRSHPRAMEEKEK